MCGLFGAIGPNWDASIVRALAIANRERGTDSLGLFNSRGKYVKRAVDPFEALGDGHFTGFLRDTTPWFIAGHTRLATRGTVRNKNAHPFRYGRIIGSHNGTCYAPKKYAVDSMYLIDTLQHGYESLDGIGGYWALTWFDGSDFFIGCEGNSVFIAKCGNCLYYSSDPQHLTAATGAPAIQHVTDGMVLRFDMKLADACEWEIVRNQPPADTDDEYVLTPRARSVIVSETVYDPYLEDLADKCGFASFDDACEAFPQLDRDEVAWELEWDAEQIEKERLLEG